MVFFFLCTTDQGIALTFEGTFDLHKNLDEKKGIGFKNLDETIKKDLSPRICSGGRQVHQGKAKHKSFKGINLRIGETATKIKIPGKLFGITKG